MKKKARAKRLGHRKAKINQARKILPSKMRMKSKFSNSQETISSRDLD